MSKVSKMWISWHFQARTRNIAQSLKIPVYECFRNKNLVERHVLSSLWTIKILLTKKPDKIIIQCSFLLHLLVVIYKLIRLGKIILIVDCHTKALRRKAPGLLNYLFWPLKKLSFKYSDLIIISNSGLLPDIERLHTNYMILPDKIPQVSIKHEKPYPSKYCVYISSFAVDEPFYEILELSEILVSQIKIFWTGKYPSKIEKIKSKYKNIYFTGYCTFDEYYNLIGNADCLMALTNEEDCLQSGAYEALSFEIPLVISDTKALRSFFHDAAVYTDHLPKNIANAILLSLEQEHYLKSKMKELMKLKSKEFDGKLIQLHSLLERNTKL